MQKAGTAAAGSCLHREPSVHLQDVPGDVVGRRGRQKQNRLGDFFSRGEPIERHRVEDGVPRLLVELVGHVGLHVPRRHHVDCHVAAAELLGEALREADDAGFGGGVVRLARVARGAHDGGNVDDRAALLAHHGHVRRLAEVERALQVRVDHVVPVRLPHAEQEPIPRDAGVVDEHVERSEVLRHCVDVGLRRVEIGHVSLQR